MDSMRYKALDFAVRKHSGQFRRGSGVPYVTHCIEVARKVEPVLGSTDTFCIALLHDTLEDTDTSYNELATEFNSSVADGVRWLTNYKADQFRNRSERKRADASRLAKSPWHIQTIKCADMLHNLSDMRETDTEFLPRYTSDCEMILSHLHLCDLSLRGQLLALIAEIRSDFKKI